MIPQIAYAASLVYSPRGQSQVSAKSRVYRSALKRADPEFLRKAAALVGRQVAEGRFPGFFGPDVALVPVPGSAPRRDNSLWVAERLADALLSLKLAGSIWRPIRRANAVPKSAYAGPGGRPTVETHVASLQVDDLLAPHGKVLLIDDIITKGSTLLASATALTNAVPGLDVRAFALIRTMGLQPEIAQIVEPVVGTVSWLGDADREP